LDESERQEAKACRAECFAPQFLPCIVNFQQVMSKNQKISRMRLKIGVFLVAQV